jgi:hypothetical protein
MPFDVYPIPQTAPLLVATGATSALIPITQRKGPDNVAEAGTTVSNFPDTMFIRVAMLPAGGLPLPGPIPAANKQPTIFLKANAGTATEITSVWPMLTPIFDADGITDVADAGKHLADANNVYLIKVLLNVPVGTTWQMQIKNNDDFDHNFTWVVASSLAESRQPWIDAPTATINFDALTTQTPGRILTIVVPNKGTGPLNITDSVGGNAGSPKFIVDALPLVNPIPPNNNGDLKVRYVAPATIEQVNANYDIGTNDTLALNAAGHNRRVPLQGIARQLEISLLLDASGSMGFTPAGGAAVADTDSRWGKLKAASNQFLDLLGTLGDGKGRFGIAVFPDFTIPTYPPASSPSSGDIVAPVGITAANVTDAKNKLDAPPPTLTPRKAEPNAGATPIGHGIGRTIGTTVASFGHFQGTADAKNLNKRFLVLMTDGANNSGPPNPPDFYGAGATSFNGKKVKVLAVGYGEPNTGFEVDHTLLNTIATQSNGQFLDAGVDDAGMSLKKDFRATITAGLSLDPTTDPSGLLTPGRTEARHQVTITPYDTRVAFVVNWKRFDVSRVRVTLLTPTCELITPASPRTDPNITFRNHPTYAIYGFNHDYLRNAADPTNPRYGTWRLIISGNLDDQQSEPYDFEVMTESRLNLTLTTDRANYFAGDTINLTAALTLDGKGITNASVTVRLTAPGQSSDNWLAGTRITRQDFLATKDRLGRADVTALGIKVFALKQNGIVFTDVPRSTEIKMTDSANDGRYTASFTNTATPGNYEFYVTAIGQTADGVTFRREKRLSLRVGVRPDPVFTLIDIIYRTQFDGELVFNVADVRVTPRDSFGNVVLIDPEFDPRVSLTVRDGTFTAPLTWNLDASYGQTVSYSAGTTPSIGLIVDGEVIVPPTPLVPTHKLTYVDKVIRFRAGAEAKPGANKHTDPDAALGDPTRKKPDEFVSLGARGSLVVAVNGKLIEPIRGGDDITVFVHPDEEPRAYEVEVLPIPAALPVGATIPVLQFGWVSLGTSPGITQSFNLRKAGVKIAAAIRISDRSGLTRDSQFKPSSTPGVSIAGVGVKKTSDFPGGTGLWLKLIEQIIKWLKKRKD